MSIPLKLSGSAAVCAVLLAACSGDSGGPEPCPDGFVRFEGVCIPGTDAAEDAELDQAPDAGGDSVTDLVPGDDVTSDPVTDRGTDTELDVLADTDPQADVVADVTSDVVTDLGTDTEPDAGGIGVPFSIDEAGYVPGGFYGDGEAPGAVTMSNACGQRAGDETGDCHHVEWIPGSDGFAGAWWLFPADNAGDEPGLALPEGATDVTFYAWGDAGGEVVNFRAGLSPDVDGFSRWSGGLELTTEPTLYTVSLCGSDYANNEDGVVAAFGWGAADASAMVAFNIDDIQWTTRAEGCDGAPPLVIVDDVGYTTTFLGDVAGIEGGPICANPRPGEGYGGCTQWSWPLDTDPNDFNPFAAAFWVYPPDTNLVFDPNAPAPGPGLELPAGATEVAFYAWGEAGGEEVEFWVGWPFSDGFSYGLPLVLTTEPTEYTISLCGQDYDDIVSPFGWFTEQAGITFNVDGIVWREAEEPCPEPTDDLVLFDDQWRAIDFFIPFQDSTNAIRLDSTEVHAGTSSLKLEVPGTGFTGGAFDSGVRLDLSGFDALVFWARADGNHVLDVSGIGLNSLTEATHRVDWENVALTSTWTEYIIPIPLPSELTNEDGLFWFAEGSAGAYTIWLDNVRYTTLEEGVLGAPRPSFSGGAISLDIGGTAEVSGLQVVFPVNGDDQTLIPSPRYFTFSSSNESVATIDEWGVVTAESAGTADITAALGAVPAPSTLTVTVLSGLDPVDLPITFDDAGVDYTLVDFGGTGTALAEDPTDSANTVASTSKFAGAVSSAGTYVDVATPVAFSGFDTALSVRVYTPEANTPVRLKIENAGGSVFSEVEVNTSAANAWETLTFDFSSPTGGTPVNPSVDYGRIVIFFDFGTGGDGATYYWDDVELVVGGGDDAPTEPAPTPPVRDPGDVISIFSGAYDDVPVDTFRTFWSVGDLTTPDPLIEGDAVKRYTEVDVVGIEFAAGNAIDASGMTHVHIDVWTPDATELGIRLVDFGAGGTFLPEDDNSETVLWETSATTSPSLVVGTWVSLDVPMATLASSGLDSVTDLAQLVLTGQPSEAATLYIDNIYFYAERSEQPLFGEPVSSDAPPLANRIHGLSPSSFWAETDAPLPTNAWWMNLVIESGTLPVNAFPYVVWSDGGQLLVSAHAAVVEERFTYVLRSQAMRVRALESLGAHRVTAWDDLSVTLEWTATEGTMTVPLVRGSPYVTAVYDGLTPRLTSQFVMDLGDSPNPGTRAEVSLSDGSTWIIYASSSIGWTVAGQVLTATAPFTGTIRVALVGDGDSAESLLDAHADAVVTGGQVSATTQGDTATMSFEWSVDGDGAPLMMALPHHLPTLQSEIDSGLTYRTIRGDLVAVTDATWTFEEPLTPITWSAPRPIDPSRRVAIETALEADASLRPVSSDPYFFGKQVAAGGRLALIADELGRDDLAGPIRTAIAEELAPWAAGTNAVPLVYDQTWGGIVVERGLNDSSIDFGQGYYNDHHFHYGYHLYAAAALARRDPAWAVDNADYVGALVRDFGNPSRDDPYFPFFRNKDWYLGHSYAAGLFENVDSRNQESSSEAVNAYYGMALWGLATGDLRLYDLGRLALATEIRSAQTYWQIRDDDTIYPAPFRDRGVVGILWDQKAEYRVFFDPEGDNDEFIYGIQMLPFTPISEELFDPVWAADVYPFIEGTILGRSDPPLAEGWRGFMLMFHAVVDPTTAWDEVQTLTSYDDGNTETNTLYWVATRP